MIRQTAVLVSRRSGHESPIRRQGWLCWVGSDGKLRAMSSELTGVESLIPKPAAIRGCTKYWLNVAIIANVHLNISGYVLLTADFIGLALDTMCTDISVLPDWLCGRRVEMVPDTAEFQSFVNLATKISTVTFKDCISFRKRWVIIKRL